jgi:hypothetical protein
MIEEECAKWDTTTMKTPPPECDCPGYSLRRLPEEGESYLPLLGPLFAQLRRVRVLVSLLGCIVVNEGKV